ncbi:MAG TPA: galactokinase [Kofleriaceae bacterium]|nr:galactokinase [Kofleriaceae bacterium]
MISASAPGRVNLIGEHTDYNGGLVLPTPIPQRTRVELELRDDARVIVSTAELATSAEFVLGNERRSGTWLDYVQGCTAAARRAGFPLHGANIAISSNVPLGSGLSSSAALEVAVLRAFREALHLDLDDLALALLGQRAENDLVGAPVGAMDQVAVSMGTPGAALLIDMRTLAARRIPLPHADLLVISSGIQHDHAAGDYRTRRAECEEAARLLGVKLLSDLDVGDLARICRLPTPLRGRVRHVVTENARVRQAVEAIEQNDLVRLGVLFRESHKSMRDDYEVSIAAIDMLVEIAEAQPDVYGARLTGGGFGGSIVAIAKPGSGERAADAIIHEFARTGYSGQVLIAGEVPCDPS